MRNARSFLHLAVANARGTHPNTLARAFNQRVYRLKVHIPATLGDVVRVTHAISELRSATAYFTYFCHNKYSPAQTQVRRYKTLEYQLGDWRASKTRLPLRPSALFSLCQLSRICTVYNESARQQPIASSNLTLEGEDQEQFRRVPSARCLPPPVLA